MNENPEQSMPEQPTPEQIIPEQSASPIPAPEPQQPVAPAPLTPEQQQTEVAQQYFAQPQAAPVQYVVAAPSLKGVKGWLLFFAVAFAFAGVGYIGSFFDALSDLGSASNVIGLVFMPFLAILSIASTVFIAMEKQLGKWLAVGTLALGALYSLVNTIVAFLSDTGATTVPLLLSGILIGLVIQGLVILYFFVSKRVEETLIK